MADENKDADNGELNASLMNNLDTHHDVVYVECAIKDQYDEEE